MARIHSQFFIIVLVIVFTSSCKEKKANGEYNDSFTDSSKTTAQNKEKDSSTLSGPLETEDIDVIYHEFKEIEEGKELTDADAIRAIFDEALVNGKAYSLLRYLTKKIGARISGSPQAAAAVEWSHQVMDTMGLEKVWKQPLMVPRWIRGEKEIGRVVNSVSLGSFDLAVTALGGSVSTPKNGLTAEIIEVNNFMEMEGLGSKAIEGKIVFFNRRMDPRFINTFYAYGGCVDQRWGGAMEAAKYGAVGVLVRSMTLAVDDFPHTGSMGYNNEVEKIPAMAVSTKGAVTLSKLLKQQNDLKFYMQQNCEMLDDVPSYNVVGEIRGSEFPDEIIIVGGHLDSWDVGEGAHDDGAGCVQSIEVLRIFKELGVRPKRTIRAVMFMNEENGLRGGKKYAELAAIRGENHIAAIETDRGGFAPRYFAIENNDEEKLQQQLILLKSWIDILKEYGVYDIKEGGSGSDISPLKNSGSLLIGLVPESQRYFDYHHSDNDVFENVNERELHLGAAAMASLIYLISEHGL